MALEARLTSPARILRSTTNTIEVTVYDGGTAEQPSSGTPTYTVTRADGTELATGTITFTAGVGTFSLAAQTDLDILKVSVSGSWNASAQTFVVYVEVVGGHLFTEAQARAFKVGAATPFSNPTKYPGATIADARDRITDLMAERTGVSWVPRFHRLERAGTGSYELWLPHHRVITIQSVSFSGSAQSIGNFTVNKDTGCLYVESGSFPAPTRANPVNVVVEYEHGYEYPRDGANHVGLAWLAASTIESNVPDRADSVTNEFGNIRFAPYAPSGDPIVDAWLRDHDERLPVS